MSSDSPWPCLDGHVDAPSDFQHATSSHKNYFSHIKKTFCPRLSCWSVLCVKSPVICNIADWVGLMEQCRCWIVLPMPKYNNNFKIENRKLDETIHGVTAIISIWLYIGFIQQIYCPCLESAPCGGVLQIFISYHYRLHCIPARVKRTGQLGSYHSNKLYSQDPRNE